MGQRHPHRSGRNIRVLLYGHYRIVYEHGAAGDIRVLGVFHGALDLKRHLRLQ
jgi:plasmid stabilization system protein ParE